MLQHLHLKSLVKISFWSFKELQPHLQVYLNQNFFFIDSLILNFNLQISFIFSSITSLTRIFKSPINFKEILLTLKRSFRHFCVFSAILCILAYVLSYVNNGVFLKYSLVSCKNCESINCVAMIKTNIYFTLNLIVQQ